jgi:putative transposase
MSWVDRAFIAALARRLPHHRWISLLVTPTTASQADPPPAGLRTLAVRLATETRPGLPARPRRTRRTRYQISASTVWKIPQTAGIDPSTRRSEPSWRDFLRAQAHAILARDLVHVDTINLTKTSFQK